MTATDCTFSANYAEGDAVAGQFQINFGSAIADSAAAGSTHLRQRSDDRYRLPVLRQLRHCPGRYLRRVSRRPREWRSGGPPPVAPVYSTGNVSATDCLYDGNYASKLR